MLEKVKELLNKLENTDLSNYVIGICDWGNSFVLSMDFPKSANLKIYIKNVNDKYYLSWYDKDTEITPEEYFNLAAQLMRIKSNKTTDDINYISNYLTE